MQENIDGKFLSLYRFVKDNHNTSDFIRFFDFLTIKIYLLATGRGSYTPARMHYKLKLKITQDFVYALGLLVRSVIKSKLSKPFGCVILVYEPSHLSQALGLGDYVKKYNPIYITTKKNYVKVIQEKIKGSNVVFIPNAPKIAVLFKKGQVTDLFNQYGITIPETTAVDVSGMMNEIYHTYSVTKFFFNSIVNSSKIKFSYIFNDLTFTGRAIAELSSKKGIKSFYIMHGLLSDEFIENLHICDNYLVFGDYVRNILSVKEGIQNQQVYTIGAPYLSYYLQLQEPEIFNVEVKNKVPQGKKVALVLLSGPGHSVSPQHHRSIIETIKETIKEKSDSFYFIFKLHPKDSINNFSSLFEDDTLSRNFGLYEFNKLGNKETIFDWLKIADVVITGASTTALEGMYMNKPIVTLDLMHGFDNDTLFITEGATYHCTSKEELLVAMNYLEEHNFRTKGKADEMSKNYFSDASRLNAFYSDVMDKLIA